MCVHEEGLFSRGGQSWYRVALCVQLNLRLKAVKRQMDEAEEEIDRLEHSKKKLQRDLEEQQEANEQLQNQLKALRNEMR